MIYNQIKGMIDYYETKSQPITKLMVWQAYKEVKTNAGSGGIDKMSWDYLRKNASTELYVLWNRLSSGSYFPNAVKSKNAWKLVNWNYIHRRAKLSI